MRSHTTAIPIRGSRRHPFVNNNVGDKSSRVPRMHKDERVIIMAPVGQDAAAIADLLQTRGFETQIFRGLDECCRQITERAGVLLVTEEALESARGSLFLDVLKAQPSWSEL